MGCYEERAKFAESTRSVIKLAKLNEFAESILHGFCTLKIISTRIRFNVFWLWFVSEIWSEHLIPFNYVFRFIASLFQNEHFKRHLTMFDRKFLFSLPTFNWKLQLQNVNEKKITEYCMLFIMAQNKWEIQYFYFFKQVQANKFRNQSTFCWMRKVLDTDTSMLLAM